MLPAGRRRCGPRTGPGRRRAAAAQGELGPALRKDNASTTQGRAARADEVEVPRRPGLVPSSFLCGEDSLETRAWQVATFRAAPGRATKTSVSDSGLLPQPELGDAPFGKELGGVASRGDDVPNVGNQWRMQRRGEGKSLKEAGVLTISAFGNIVKKLARGAKPSPATDTEL